jgi:peptidyl-prolyl cis-trans isomerase D
MAFIEKIRKRGWLVLVLVGLGLLGFLVPPDAVAALFGRGKTSLGTINGHEVSVKEWQDAVGAQKKMFNYSGSESALSNDTWSNLVDQYVMNPVYKALGIQITDEELEDIMFGEYLSPYVKSTFYNGQDSAQMKEGLRKNFEQMEQRDPEMYIGYQKLIRSKRQREKFDDLVRKGMYANQLDGKWSFKETNDKVSVDYVVKTYAEIPDSTVTVTESDIRSYYNKHKKDREYKQLETTRNANYIRFPVLPTAQDSNAVRENMNSLMASFAAAESDSAFAAMNSANPNMISSNYRSGALPEPFNSQFFSDSVGKVVGPYFENGAIKISKIHKRGMESDSVQARHILIKDTSPAGKAKVDSIKKVIEQQKNFAEMAAKFGTDGTKDKGGDLGMFARGAMVKPFEDACFNGKVGELQIVTTNFGLHIVEVTKKTALKPFTSIYTIEKRIEPSSATRKNAYDLAQQFSSNYSDSTSFRLAADTLNGGTKIIRAQGIRSNATSISALADAGAVVEWVYRADVGDVSQPIKIGNDFIIACLMDVLERGEPTFQNVYERMKQETMKEKKAEVFMEKMKAGSLQDIATNIGTQVKKGENLTLRSSNIPGSGVSQPENELIGLCFGLKKDFISSPIKGKGGVYVIQRTSDIVEGQSQDGYVTDKNNAMTNMQSRAAMQVYNSLKEESDVEDNRFEN